MENCCAPKCSSSKRWGIFFFRVIIGVIFLSHGMQKLSNMEGTIQFFNFLHFGSFLAYLVAWIETLGGISLILGIFVRIFAPLLSFVMLVAILSVKGGEISLRGFGKAEFEVALLGSTVLLSVIKSGALSLASMCRCSCHESDKKHCKVCKVAGCENHSEKKCCAKC